MQMCVSRHLCVSYIFFVDSFSSVCFVLFLFVCFCFLFFLFYYYSLENCFSGNRKRVDLDSKEVGGRTRRSGEREALIRIHCIKYIFFNKKSHRF